MKLPILHRVVTCTFPSLTPTALVFAVGAASLAATSIVSASDLVLTKIAVAEPNGAGDVARGSGTLDGIPDGKFTYAALFDEFGAPVASVDGHVAFSGSVLYPPAPGQPNHHNGIFGGRPDVSGVNFMGTLLLDNRPAPGTLGAFTGQHARILSVNSAGHVVFSATYATAPGGPPVPTGGGVWWGDSGSDPYITLNLVQLTPPNNSVNPQIQPFQNGNYIGYTWENSVWKFSKPTNQPTAIAAVGMSVGALGAGVSITSLGPIHGMDDTGRMLLTVGASDGGTHLLFTDGPGLQIPIVSIGRPAPEIPGKTIASYTATANHRGEVAVLVTLNPFNNESALYAGPAAAVKLIARSSAPLSGMTSSWAGPPVIDGTNHVLLYAPSLGILTLPETPSESPTYAPLPDYPFPPLTGSGWSETMSFNALAQVASLKVDSVQSGANGRDLWWFNPGDGWINIARTGQTLVVGGESILVSKIGFIGSVGSYAGGLASSGSSDGGFPSGLTDDGTLVFSLNGKYVVRAELKARTGFIFNNAKGDSNWHTNGGSPPTNWKSQEDEPRDEPPGVAEPDTAVVVIPQQYSVVLDQVPAPIGSLQLDGSLTIKQRLTVNLPSTLKNLTVQGPGGALTANNTTVVTDTVNWQAGTLSLAAAVLRNEGTFNATSGTVDSLGGTTAFENRHYLRKDGAGAFTMNVPLKAYEKSAGNEAEIEVSQGTLSLLGGGTFEGDQSIALAAGSVLELAGQFSVAGEPIFTGAATTSHGTLKLGTVDQPAVITVAPGADVGFALNDESTEFIRGALQGVTGAANNEGQFVWKGGRIALGALGDATGPVFSNDQNATFVIDENQTPNEARQLDGLFRNNGRVEQRGTFTLGGVIQNQKLWTITRASNLTGTGLFYNDARFLVELSEMGTVSIDGALYNSSDFFNYHPAAEFIVGRLSGTNPQTTVQLVGTVENLREKKLRDGWWRVGPNCTLTFPSEIDTLDGAAVDLIGAGAAISSLNLRRNRGWLTLIDHNYTIAGDLENGIPSFGYALMGIAAAGTSELTITGSLTNHDGVVCEQGAKITVDQELINFGRIVNHGEIKANRMRNPGIYGGTGSLKIEVGGCIGGDQLAPGERKTVVSALPREPGVYQAMAAQSRAGSFGTLSFIGGLALLDTASLDIELGGTQGNLSDAISVTGAATLAGTLLVSLTDDFQPAASDSFTIVTAGSITGQFANAPSGQRVLTTDGSGSFQIFYGTGSPHPAGSVVLANWLPAAAGSPVITAQPALQTLVAGSTLTLSVVASGTGPLTYQWRFRGTPIANATSSTYTVPSVQGPHDGSYSVVITNALGTVYSEVASLTVNAAAPNNARLLNLSTRAQALTGDDVLIPGFVIAGTGNKRLLIRAVGPTLGKAPFNLAGTLPDPGMRLLKRNPTTTLFEEIAANDNWGTNSNAAAITQTASDLFAFPFDDNLEAALLMDLTPGEYTVIAGGANNTTGLAIVELYDADAGMPGTRLINISNRGYAGAGDQVMIPGFVISSEGPKTLLVRVVGPTLGAAPFNVAGTMVDPKLEVFPGGGTTPILTNDNWSDSPDAAYTAQVAQELFAFPLDQGSKDAAFVITLPPGIYTVVGSSATAGGTGVVLVEVYVVP